MLVIMTYVDVRFTPNGKRVAIIHTNLYPHFRFECWDDTIIDALFDIKWPIGTVPSGRKEALLEVTGNLEIKSYKTIEQTVVRQNNFVIKGWRLG